jgi:hypothetical protein
LARRAGEASAQDGGCRCRQLLLRTHQIKQPLLHTYILTQPPPTTQESWWVILATKDSKIVNIQKVTKKEKKFSHDIKFMAPPKGEYDMDVYVMSNA